MPGGRVIQPLGETHVTGAGPFGLALSASGKTLVTADTGPGVNSVTILDQEKSGRWTSRRLLAQTKDDDDRKGDPEDATTGWRGVFMGIAFNTEHSAFVSEGNSGKVALFDFNNDRRRAIDLNQQGYQDSYTGDLAFDPERNLLYAVDQANFRVAVIDAKSRVVLASVKTGRLPFALALSTDRRRLYVTDVGMFEYQAIPGADPKLPAGTGLPFPAFGFPSAESISGAERKTAAGTVVKVPGLGDPNVREASSVCVIDVTTPSAPKVVTFIPTGPGFSAKNFASSGPSGIVTAGERVFVSNANLDSIAVIDATQLKVTTEIPIRIPGLEQVRGVLPIGLAIHPRTGWLLAAEAGINAIAVIDPDRGRVLGHLPVGWFPTRVAIEHDTVFVANGRGYGQGPSAAKSGNTYGSAGERDGSVSIFSLPEVADFAAHTRFVYESNGFLPRPAPDLPVPQGIKHVVLIVKENRTYDEVFGDVEGTTGAPELARFGTRGYVDGRRQRLSLKDVNVTPNHHAIASQFTLSDNFYADSDVSVDGHHWLVGSPPNAWTESTLMASYGSQKKDFRIGSAPGRLLFAGSDSSVHPEEQIEGGTIWHHLERYKIPFRNFGEGFELAGVNEGKDLEPTGARFLTNVPMPDPLYRNTSRNYPGFNMNIPDQYRATQLINELREQGLSRFTFIHLPNDHTDGARPDDGYPYRESFVSDNDYALGRILEFLSGLPEWKETVVFITEDDAQSGVDHIDAHRTVLLAAGPWVKHGYISHRNSSFPGLLKTIFRLLGIPPLNLFDAAATDLSDVFAASPELSQYKLLKVDERIFNPATVRVSTSGKPGAKMDR